MKYKQGARTGEHLRRIADAFYPPLVSVLLGLLTGGLVIAWSGGNPLDGIWRIIVGGYGSTYYLTTTLTRATPIIFAGLASSLAWGSGYETMGISGQMTLGAFTAAVTAVHIHGPGWLVALAAMLAGMCAGMAWSLLSAWLSACFEIYLLIVTLMLNYIAENAASYLTSYVFRDPFAADNLVIQTQKITQGVYPRLISGYTLHGGFLIALFCVFFLLFFTKRTCFGYEASMNGRNSRFAHYGGVNSRRTMYRILLMSGAVAGLGGAVEVLGVRYQFVDKMITSPGYAWNGITASLMSGNNPVGVFFSGIFLAGIITGGNAVERGLNIPQEITSIIQGVLTIFVTARFLRGSKHRFRRRGAVEGGGKYAA